MISSYASFNKTRLSVIRQLYNRADDQNSRLQRLNQHGGGAGILTKVQSDAHVS